MLSCKSNKTFIQIKTREEEERKRREKFFIQNPKHKIFTSAEFFTSLNFTTISSSYIYLYYNKEEKKQFSFQG